MHDVHKVIFMTYLFGRIQGQLRGKRQKAINTMHTLINAFGKIDPLVVHKTLFSQKFYYNNTQYNTTPEYSFWNVLSKYHYYMVPNFKSDAIKETEMEINLNNLKLLCNVNINVCDLVGNLKPSHITLSLLELLNSDIKFEKVRSVINKIPNKKEKTKDIIATLEKMNNRDIVYYDVPWIMGRILSNLNDQACNNITEWLKVFTTLKKVKGYLVNTRANLIKKLVLPTNAKELTEFFKVFHKKEKTLTCWERIAYRILTQFSAKVEWGNEKYIVRATNMKEFEKVVKVLYPILTTIKGAMHKRLEYEIIYKGIINAQHSNKPVEFKEN